MRGRQDLLVQIKRSAGTTSTTTAAPMGGGNNTTVSQRALPASVTSGDVKVANGDKPGEVTHLKSEVQELKQRIASMTKNIDDLTSMVKNISVKDEEAPFEQAAPGQKRKKIKAEIADTPMHDPFPALLSGEPILPDVASSSDVMSAPASSVSDDAFVDDLFEVFANEEGELLSMSSLEDVPASGSITDTNPNKPDPELMQRIEDSLSTIPKDMHEMVADRLIDAINNTQPIANCADGILSNDGTNKLDDRQELKDNTVSLPVAVATLRTILAGYGVSIECSRQAKDQPSRGFSKSLPVVPMHA